MTTTLSPLLTTLYLVQDCGIPTTTEALCARYEISQRQLLRYVQDARQLGAQLRSTRTHGRHYWVCDNWWDIQKTGRLAKWISLEEQRALI